MGAKRSRWKDDEIQILKEKIDDGFSYAEIAGILNRTEEAVKLKYINLRVKERGKVSTKREWTKEEEYILISMLNDKKTFAEIAERLGRGKSAIMHRARCLGIKYQGGNRPWTESDIQDLRDLWKDGYVSISMIANRMCRSNAAIRNMASLLNLGIKNRCTDDYTVEDVADILNMSPETVRNWFSQGIIKARRCKQIYGKPYAVKYEDLLSFLKENPEKYDASKIDEIFLIDVPDWLLEKRQYDKKHPRPKNKMRPWTNSEDYQLLRFYNDGRAYKYMAEKFGRSYYAIRTHLDRLVYHSDEEVKKLMGSGKRYSKEELELLEKLTPDETLMRIANKMGTGRTERSLEKQCLKYGWEYRVS